MSISASLINKCSKCCIREYFLKIPYVYLHHLIIYTPVSPTNSTCMRISVRDIRAVQSWFSQTNSVFNQDIWTKCVAMMPSVSRARWSPQGAELYNSLVGNVRRGTEVTAKWSKRTKFGIQFGLLWPLSATTVSSSSSTPTTTIIMMIIIMIIFIIMIMITITIIIQKW